MGEWIPYHDPAFPPFLVDRESIGGPYPSMMIARRTFLHADALLLIPSFYLPPPPDTIRLTPVLYTHFIHPG